MKVRTKERQRLYKVFLLLLKYVPIISTLLLTIHSIICILGYDEPILDNIVGGSILRAALLLAASYAFEFCWLHRSCVVFNLIVKTLITIHLEIGLGIFLILCELTTAIAGIVIMTLLVEHRKGFINCNGNIKLN